jgi:enoyl-CoA hydratase
MQFTEIAYEVHGRVAQVRLNRPEYRNPIGRITIEELSRAFDAACADDGVRAIVLCAAGSDFSGGHDIGTPAKVADDAARPFPPGPRGGFERSWTLYMEHGLRWRNLPKPTIAAIQGRCIWGGWMVATTMDVLFASDDALFLGSHFQYFSVPWDVGIRKAKEILFEPRFIDAAEAQELGFVNRVLPRDELLAEAMAYAARVAENDTFALRMTKLNINQAQDLMGYTNHLVATHTKVGGGSSFGTRLPSGQRRVAPVPRAMANLGHTRGHRPRRPPG